MAIALLVDPVGIVRHFDDLALAAEMLQKDLLGVAAEGNEQRVGGADVVQLSFQVFDLCRDQRGIRLDLGCDLLGVGFVQSDEGVRHVGAEVGRFGGGEADLEVVCQVR